MDTTRTAGREHLSGSTDPAPDAGYRLVPAFEGYPYLVTRIGHTALRHIALVPADWSRERLVDLARRQAEANQLETCLCLGPAEAVYVVPGHEPSASTFVPRGIPAVDRLVLAGRIHLTDGDDRRHEALLAYAKRWRGTGYLVGDGLEGGRLATGADMTRLSGSDDRGMPRGLRPCPTCGMWRGEYLAVDGEGNGDRRPRVIAVSCRCDNHNLCAGCGEPLADGRLSAWAWHGASVGYLAAYAGLSHRCFPPRPARPTTRA